MSPAAATLSQFIPCPAHEPTGGLVGAATGGSVGGVTGAGVGPGVDSGKIQVHWNTVG